MGNDGRMSRIPTFLRRTCSNADESESPPVTTPAGDGPERRISEADSGTGLLGSKGGSPQNSQFGMSNKSVIFQDDVELDVKPSPAASPQPVMTRKASIADSIDVTSKRLIRINTGQKKNFCLDLDRKELTPYTPKEENDSVLFLDEIPDEIRDPLAAFDINHDGKLTVKELANAAETYIEMKTAKTSYRLSAFPAALQEKLAVFDSDGDGQVDVDELAEACNLYEKYKRNLKQRTKQVVGLSVVSALCILGTLAMMTFIIWVMKDTGVSDGKLTTKDGSSVLSTGKIMEVVEFQADSYAYANLMEARHVVRERPDAVQVLMAHGREVTFPPDFMDLNTEHVVLHSTALGITLIIRNNSMPLMRYPRFSKNVGDTSSLSIIRIFGATGATEFSKMETHAVENVTEVSDVHTLLTDEEADAEYANEATQEKMKTLSVYDLSGDLLKSSIANVMRGDPASWSFLMGPTSREQLEDLCLHVSSFNGTCGSVEGGLNLGTLSVEMAQEDLMLLLHSDDMLVPNKYGVASVEKTFASSSGEYYVMEPHEADPQQLSRHGQVKNMVFSTPRGRHLLQGISRRSLQEEWYGEALSGKEDCYTSDTVYTGDANIAGGVPCDAWREGDYSYSPGRVGCGGATVTGRPFCPIVTGSGRGLYYCDVPHCVLSMYSTDQAPLGVDDWNWGLSRVESGEDDFTLDPNSDGNLLDGTGVHCFVLDSGVNVHHEEFRGQVVNQYDGFNGNNYQVDEDGHGTHVAGIMAGLKHGVAPGCKLHAVKVLGMNGRSGRHTDGSSSITKGLQWVLETWTQIKAQGATTSRVGVVNLSLGGGYASVWDTYISALTNAGLVVVVSAGNSDVDACTMSPAHVSQAVTVGATNLDDTKGIYSNWGACIDIFAPGTGIRSASNTDNSGYVVKGGTSMAAPFVSGALALYLQAHPTATVQEAVEFILDTAISGQVEGLSEQVFSRHGYTAAGWQEFKAQQAGVVDDVGNIAASPNKLLHLDALLRHGGDADLPTCPAGTGLSQWQAAESCPPRNSVVCGTQEHSIPAAQGLNWPLVQFTRQCVAEDCACGPTEELQQWRSCAPSGNEYTYVAECGMPTAHLGTLSELKWLERKTLRFAPDSDLTFTVCTSANGGELPMDINSPYAQAITKMVRDDSSRKISFPSGWSFKFMGVEHRTVRLASNGYIVLNGGAKPGAHPTGGTLDEQLSLAKGAGISGLFTDLDPDSCGQDSCGEVYMLCMISARKQCAFTWVDMSSYGQQPGESGSTFQIVLYLDGTGEFELAYGSLSSTSIGRAAIGVSPGTGSSSGVFHPRYSDTCTAQMS